MALTGRKLGFAKAIRAGKSNRDAAIAGGYSPSTASAAGSRLAKDPDVRAYLAEMKRRSVAPTKPAVPAKKSASAHAAPDLPPEDLFPVTDDPLRFLTEAMNNSALDPRQRIDAAKALMPFKHQKLGEGGKKDQKQDAAKKVAGRFASAAPPKLVAAGGKKV